MHCVNNDSSNHCILYTNNDSYNCHKLFILQEL